MPTEIIEEKQSVSEPIKFVNPFCRVTRHKEFPDLSDGCVVKITNMELDKETGKVIPVFEKFDMETEIQKCKDLAGLDYMKRLLMTGQASPEDFYDDGKSGLDTTIYPKTVHEAKELADNNAEELGELAKALNLSDEDGITPKQLEAALTAAIEKKFNELAAAKAAQTKEGDAQ